MNEIIKQRWVALGPRNYGKSVEWKLEGDPWDTEGLYSDHTRGIYLLCLILEAIQPLGWKLVIISFSSSGSLFFAVYSFSLRYHRQISQLRILMPTREAMHLLANQKICTLGFSYMMWL